MIPAVKWVLFICSIAIVPALMTGTIRKVKARLQNRQGSPIWQPLFDLIKLCKKDETISDTASWMFRWTGALNLVIALCLAVMVPWLSPQVYTGPSDLFMIMYLFALMRLFMLLVALDAGSAFGAFAASREATLSVLVEPPAMISLAALAVAAKSSDLQVVFASQHIHPAIWILSASGFMLASLVELSRMPIDDPTTHLELTMIHEAMILEASGKNLALFEFSNAIKLTVLFGLSGQCFLHAFTELGTLNEFVQAGSSVLVLFATSTAVGIFESIAVKLNWRKAPEFIAYAVTLSAISAMIAIGGGAI